MCKVSVIYLIDTNRINENDVLMTSLVTFAFIQLTIHDCYQCNEIRIVNPVSLSHAVLYLHFTD